MKRLEKFGVAAVCLLLVSCGNSKDKSGMQPVKVKVQTVKVADAGNVRNFSGTVESGVESAMSFSVSGTVNKNFVYLGKKVKKGTLLASVDETAARCSHEAAEAALAQASDAYDRMKKLHDSGSLPDIQWVEAENKLRQAKSVERVAYKNLEDCRLVAPFSGVVSFENIEIGQNVLPGMTVLKLASIDDVKIKVAIPEREISSVKTGEKVSLCVPALGDSVFSGSIEEKNVVANPLSHTYDVKIRVQNKHGELLPGMVAKVMIAGNTQQTYILPGQAVLLDENNQTFVWVNDNGTASRRNITCGDPAASGITVVEGICNGDEVIVEGMQKISEGMRIEIIRQ